MEKGRLEMTKSSPPSPEKSQKRGGDELMGGLEGTGVTEAITFIVVHRNLGFEE